MKPTERWRLLLGKAAEAQLGEGGEFCQQADASLAWLYDRDESLKERGILTAGEREAGSGNSILNTPDWIEKIHKLFPKETIERLEQDAVERFGIDDVVTNPEVLARVEPNQTLLKAVLKTKHLMNPEVLAMARKLVRQVVQTLMDKMRKEFRQAFSGTLDRRRRSHLKIAKNFDFKSTLKHNLKHYDGKRLILEKPYFYARTRRHTENWQIILLVDQSGSMLDSVIHTAVTASCLWELPGMSTHLVIFDTQVVDLTQDCQDPVETLMKVQLGGGTDIGRAVDYASSLIRSPKRSIVVLLTDFYEGGHEMRLIRAVKRLSASGVSVLGLAALDSEAVPAYDRRLASKLVEQGAQVGAMTPGELAEWLAEKVRF